MLCSLILASNIGCLPLDDTGFQLERHDLIIAQLSYLVAPIPPPPCLFHLLPQLHLGKAYADPHNRGIGKTRPWRVPITLCDNQLHGLKPFLPLRVVAIAHTDEAVTVLREELLRALLARLEMQPYPRGGSLGRAPGWRGAGGGAGGRDR